MTRKKSKEDENKEVSLEEQETAVETKTAQTAGKKKKKEGIIFMKKPHASRPDAAPNQPEPLPTLQDIDQILGRLKCVLAEV